MQATPVSEVRLTAYTFSQHIAKVEFDPWDMPIIILKNGQSYGVTLSPGPDMSRLKRLGKDVWGDLARDIDGMLTKKGIWPQDTPSLPVHQNYDNLVINQSQISWGINGSSRFDHTGSVNTLPDYQTAIGRLNQALSAVPAAAPSAATPAAAAAAPNQQATPLPTTPPTLLARDVHDAITAKVAADVAVVTGQRNVQMDRKLTELASDSFRTRVLDAAARLAPVTRAGHTREQISPMVINSIDQAAQQALEGVLRTDIRDAQQGRTAQQALDRIRGAYAFINDLPASSLKTNLQRLLASELPQQMGIAPANGVAAQSAPRSLWNRLWRRG